jgi:hypothetical protein
MSFPERSDGNLRRRLHVESVPIHSAMQLWLASLEFFAFIAFVAFIAFFALLGLQELLGLLGLLGLLHAARAFTVIDMPSKKIAGFGLFLIFDF